MKALILVLSALTLCQLSLAQNVSEVYHELDEYLVREVPFRHAEVDLERAIGKLESMGFPSGSYATALELLKGLKTIVEDKDCDGKKYKIVKENNEAVGGHIHKPYNFLFMPTRIESIVNYYSGRHAWNCELVYPEKFNGKYEKLANNEQVKRVETFREGYINGMITTYEENKIGVDWISSSTDQLKKKIEHLETFLLKPFLDIQWFTSKQVLKDALKYMATQSDGVKSISGTSEQLEEFIIRPCRYYISELGPDILEPALYDSEMLKDELNNPNFIIRFLDYYLGRSAYQLCTHLLDSSSKPMLDEIVNGN